jgi:hypothetical protein
MKIRMLYACGAIVRLRGTFALSASRLTRLPLR